MFAFDPPLVRGRLIRRYKRFLADVVLETGEEVTAACPNTGSMLGLAAPGTVVWLSVSDSRSRKLTHTWELLELDSGGGRALVGINTGRPNRIVEAALAAGLVSELAGYERIRREVRYGARSRVDLLLEAEGRPPCYVEIKNVHLSRTSGLAEFPDCVTARGAKHLAELARMASGGARAVMFYLVQRDDAKRFALAPDLDPAYAAAHAAARASGVEAIAYCCRLTPETISLDRNLPIIEPA